MQWLNRLICKHFGHRTGPMNTLTAAGGTYVGGRVAAPTKHQAYVFSTCRRCGVPFFVGTLMRPDEWRSQGSLGKAYSPTKPVTKIVDEVLRELGRKDFAERNPVKPWYPDDSGEWVEFNATPDSKMPPELKGKRVEILCGYEREGKRYTFTDNRADYMNWTSRFYHVNDQIVAYKIIPNNT